MKIKKVFLYGFMFTGLLLALLASGVTARVEDLAPSSKAKTNGSILYVTSDAAETGTCSDWTNPCDLQVALAASVEGDEIWAAAGTYYPGSSTDPVTVTFQLKTGVAVYGGFAGDETAREQRDWMQNSTILSGDLDRNGVLDGGNAYHVVTTGSGVDATALLDGFTITAGNAIGVEVEHRRGGGVHINAGSPTLANVIFSVNHAQSGGGMWSVAGSPMLINITFIANSAEFGGGLYTWLGSPILDNVLFFDNTASDGGGICNDYSSLTLTDVTFFSNLATWGGGGLYNFGGTPIMTNVTFSSNSAEVGGALHVSAGSPKLANVTLYGNNATFYGGGLNILTASPILTNTILWGNTPDQINGPATVTYSDIQGGHLGEGNLDIDPLFVDAANSNLRLQPGSPVIDAGSNSAVPPEVTTDLDGSPRIVDYPPSGTPVVDMGAYEAQVGGDIVYVDQDAPGPIHDGASWATAFPGLQTGLAAAVEGSEIWVADGAYYPGSIGNRLATFLLKSGVAVYGGFAGDETAWAQRDWTENPTLLSGDIDHIGEHDGGNAYHVVTGSGVTETAVLDGFIIMAGNADGVVVQSYGGGMYNDTGSPTLENVTLNLNSAINGGGMYNYDSSPRLTNVTFSGNSAAGNGGGLYSDFYSNPALADVTFSANSANNGGGMYNLRFCDPTLTNVTFLSNTATEDGGGMYNVVASDPTLTNVTFSSNSATDEGGGMYSAGSSIPTLVNVTFSANSAHYGGGMYNYIVSPSQINPTLTHVTFTGNSATDGGGMYNVNSNPTLTGAILWGNTPDQIWGPAAVTYSVVQGGYAGEGNLDADPLLDTLADNGGSTLTHALLAGSPAIDAGSPACPPPATDQRGVSRPIDGDGDSDAACDMGSYEYQPASTTTITGDLPDPSLAGQSFTVTLSVTSTLGIPTGNVTVTVSNSPATCNATLVGGLGNCTLALETTGIYTLTATYAGDDTFTPSSDSELHTVGAATTTTITGDDPDPSWVGESFTVAVSVTSTLGIPTGGVTVTVSASPETCTATLVDGLGSCLLSLATPGTYTLSADYAGDDTFAPSSGSEQHTVEVGIFLPIVSKQFVQPGRRR